MDPLSLLMWVVLYHLFGWAGVALAVAIGLTIAVIVMVGTMRRRTTAAAEAVAS